MSEFNAKNASKVVEEYVKEKIEPVVEENVRAARIRDLEKKLEIAVEALNEINLIRNFKDPAYAFTKARDISYKALLAIQGKQVGE